MPSSSHSLPSIRKADDETKMVEEISICISKVSRNDYIKTQIILVKFSTHLRFSEKRMSKTVTSHSLIRASLTHRLIIYITETTKFTPLARYLMKSFASSLEKSEICIHWRPSWDDAMVSASRHTLSPSEGYSSSTFCSSTSKTLRTSSLFTTYTIVVERLACKLQGEISFFLTVCYLSQYSICHSVLSVTVWYLLQCDICHSMLSFIVCYLTLFVVCDSGLSVIVYYLSHVLSVIVCYL